MLVKSLPNWRALERLLWARPAMPELCPCPLEELLLAAFVLASRILFWLLSRLLAPY